MFTNIAVICNSSILEVALQNLHFKLSNLSTPLNVKLVLANYEQNALSLAAGNSVFFL